MSDSSLEILPAPQPPIAVETPPRPKLHRTGVWRERLELILLIVLVFTVVNLATMRFYIEGPSMQPNFVAEQFLIVSRVNYLLGEPHRGDIVVFDAPGDDDSRNNPLLIKRLIGVPGDHIVIERNEANGQTVAQVFVNGELLYEPYINHDGIPFNCTRHCDLTLEANQYFMMGDNRNHSNDSREFGPVDRSRIVGEAIIRYWPPSDWGLVNHIAYPD